MGASADVIADHGYSALRLAAVARLAGLSQGALLHHFETKDKLTLATVEHIFARALEKTEKIIADGLQQGTDPLELMLQDFQLYFFNDDFWASLDITINALKSPELSNGIRQIVPRYRVAVYRHWQQLLCDSGWSDDDAREIVRMTSALIAGLGMRTLYDDIGGYLPATLARWRTMIRTSWPRQTGTSA